MMQHHEGVISLSIQLFCQSVLNHMLVIMYYRCYAWYIEYMAATSFISLCNAGYIDY